MSDMPETITLSRFYEEHHTFREMLCSKKYTVEQKRKAFNAIMTLALRVDAKTPEEEDAVQVAMDMMAIEVPRRLLYEEMGPHGVDLLRCMGTQTGRVSGKVPNKSNGPSV